MDIVIVYNFLEKQQHKTGKMNDLNIMNALVQDMSFGVVIEVSWVIRRIVLEALEIITGWLAH
jgi:hypothetical protein